MEIVTNVDSNADMLPVDSESDDEDLLQPERNPDRCDSDDEIPPRQSDGDEDEMTSGPPPLSTFTQPTPASPSHSSTSASPFTRKRSAPVLATQPASKKHSLPKLPSSAFYQLSAASDTSVKPRKRGRGGAPTPQPGKGKASDKCVKPRKRGRGSSSSRTTEEELGWHNREENDQTPESLNFTPARKKAERGDLRWIREGKLVHKVDGQP
ncbi:uncharacterized protein LOC117558142 isoform X2 [Gymnodraco acuticeps]|nr:uncharacterized protein LOC117558142 isoform X2 [Gymnodraco acuticeps]